MKRNKKKTQGKKKPASKTEKIYWSQKKTSGRFNDKDFTSTVIFFDGVPISMTTIYAESRS